MPELLNGTGGDCTPATPPRVDSGGSPITGGGVTHALGGNTTVFVVPCHWGDRQPLCLPDIRFTSMSRAGFVALMSPAGGSANLLATRYAFGDP